MLAMVGHTTCSDAIKSCQLAVVQYWFARCQMTVTCCALLHSSLPKLTTSEVGKSVAAAVTDVPSLFDCILHDVSSSRQDTQITALQMLAACLHAGTLTR